MNLNEVRIWLKSLNLGFNKIVLGPLTKSEKQLSLTRGVSKSKTKGSGPTSYGRIAVNCIVHWNKNLAETDTKVEELKELLYQIEPSIPIGGFVLVELITRNCVFIGFDSNEVYEYALDLEIIYKSA